jgi:hypothetical protein
MNTIEQCPKCLQVDILDCVCPGRCAHALANIAHKFSSRLQESSPLERENALRNQEKIRVLNSEIPYHPV